MGAHAVIAPKARSATLNATVSKVACGAAEVVPYITVTNLARTLRDLKDAGVWIAGTTMEADTDLYHFDASGPLAWVMGAEGEGMRRLTRDDLLVRIPMAGPGGFAERRDGDAHHAVRGGAAAERLRCVMSSAVPAAIVTRGA